VPVLSVHTTDALAMVSQEPSKHTNNFSYVIHLVANAKASVMAKGSPDMNPTKC
jgi:hypothetical protein